MKYLLFFSILISSWGAFSQEKEIVFLDSLKQKLIQSSEDSSSFLVDDIISSNTLLRITKYPKEVIDYLSNFFSDSLKRVRMAGYYASHELGKNNDATKLAETKNKIASLLLNGGVDADPKIRFRTRDFLLNRSLWSTPVSEDLIDKWRTLITQYPSELNIRHLRFIGELGLSDLKDVISNHYLPSGQFYKESYRTDAYDYYFSIEWEAMLILAKFNHKEAIGSIIATLEAEEDNLDQKFNQAQRLALLVSSQEVANFVYDLFVSEYGRKKTEPLGKGSVFAPAYGNRYLYSTMLTYFLNPMNETELQRMEELKGTTADNDRDGYKKSLLEMDLIIEWLERTKDNWELKKD